MLAPTPAPPSSAPTPAPTAKATKGDGEGNDGLSTGAIIGIAVGSFFGLLLVLFVLYKLFGGEQTGVKPPAKEESAQEQARPRASDVEVANSQRIDESVPY